MSLTIDDVRDAGILANAAYGSSAQTIWAGLDFADSDWTYVDPSILGVSPSNVSHGLFSYRVNIDINHVLTAVDAQALLAFDPKTHTVAIAFKGTDTGTDILNDVELNYGPEYQAFSQYLIPYVLNNAAAVLGATRILVTGHSLGGAMVEELLGTNSDSRLIGVSFGSPGVTGIQNNPGNDPRLLNIGHVDLSSTSYSPNQGDAVFRSKSIEQSISIQGSDIRVDLPDQPDYSLAETTVLAGSNADYGQHEPFRYEATAKTIAAELQQNADDQHPFDVRAYSYVIGSGLLTGSASANVIIGNTGFDSLLGLSGNDILDGKGGNDQIVGGDGNDIIYGGDGSDTLRGGAGNDTINGGTGNDTAVFALSRDHYNITFSGSQVIVAAVFQAPFVYEGTDTITNVENFQFGDTIYSREQLIALLTPAGNPAGGTGDQSGAGSGGYSGGGTGTATNGSDTIPGDINSTFVVGTSGQALTSAIETAGDKDYVKVYLVQGDTYHIAMQGAANHGYAALQDSFFRVRDGQDHILASPTDQVGGDQLDFTATYTGIHFISIGAGGTNFATLTGGYSLTVSLLSAPTVNHAPVANTDDQSVNYGQVVTGNVLVNDTDADHNTLSVDFLSSFHTALGGTVDLIPNGAFQYIAPGSGPASAQDSFNYTVHDGAGGSAVGTVHLNLSQPAGGGLFTTGDDFVTVPTGGGIYHALSGNDVVFGSTYSDIIYGEDGNDFLHGLDGNDYLVGGNGDDGLVGGPGDDWLVPGPGRNLVWGDGVSTDFNGFDTVDYSDATGGITVDLLQGTVTGGGVNDLVNGIDSIIGSGFADFIQPYSIAQRVYGGGGNDSLIGWTGDDELHGGTGDDILQGYIGNDRLYGDDGNDTLTGGDGNDLLNGGSGDDLVSGENDNDSIIASAGTDRLIGGDGVDTVDFSEAPAGFTSLGVVPNWGASTLEGIEIVIATPFDDNFSTGGFQELHLGAGNDAVSASSITTVYGDDGNDHVFALNVGQVFGGTGDDFLVALGTTVELHGDDGNDQLSGGDGVDHKYYGGAGDDVLSGANGNEMLSGDDGADQIYGEGGNDTLIGGSGNDVLNGGSGNDILLGDAQLSISGDITAALQGTIVQFDSSGFDATRVQNASVVKTASGYALLYAGLTFGNNYQVGLATSSDGLNWSKFSDSPVISNGGSQSWASFRELPATLMLDNGVYKLWFNGDNSNLSSDPGYKSGFGYATSTDGINWSFDANNPIRVELNSPSGNGIDLDEVVKLNGQYIAYYVNHNPSGDVLNYAISADGIHFSSDAPLSVPGGYALLAATTANIGGTDRVFAVLQDSSGVDHYATSTDGANFTIGGIVNVPSNFGITNVLFDGGQIKFFGDNGVGNVNWSFGNTNIEYATAAISSLTGNNGALGGSDTLDGGAGNDTLTGGAGDDRFVFASGYGSDIVTDFVAGAHSDDRIDLTAFHMTIGAALSRATQSGSNVVFNFDGGDTLTLLNVDKTGLNAEDFVGLKAAHDFDSNFHSDILWHNDNGTNSVWDNGQIAGAHWISDPGLVPATWHIAGKGDFDGNGQSDILWRNDNGAASIWDNGAIGNAHIISAAGVVPNSWHISGTGDFDGNGTSDILWRNDNGAASIWDDGQIGNAHIISAAGVVPNSWHIAGTGDFDGNGHSDILWRNDNGAASIWDNGQIGGAHIIAAQGIIPSGWNIAGTGDFDGNGHDDILWRNDNGAVSIWDDGQIGGAHIVSAAGVVANSWHISDTGDFDGNGHADILWRNDNGAASIWDDGAIGGAHIIAAAGVIPGGWHIV